MSTLELRAVSKAFGAAKVIHDVDMRVEDREFVVIVGPSGCGKSTLLRMIAGLEEVNAGELLIDGKRMNDVPAAKRQIAMVFQSYALYPNMTARENLAFSLKLAKVPRAEIAEKVARTAARQWGMPVAGATRVQTMDRLPRAPQGRRSPGTAA